MGNLCQIYSFSFKALKLKLQGNRINLPDPINVIFWWKQPTSYFDGDYKIIL